MEDKHYKALLGELADNLLVRAVFNLTTGQTLEYCYRDGTEVPLPNRDAFGYSQANAASLLIDEGERQQFLELNNLDKLLRRFAAGETDFRMDYRRRLQSGEVRWVRSSLHLLRDPSNGDILLFEYWYDIEELRMRELSYQALASENYDYVARIYGQTGHFTVLPKEGETYRIPPASGNDVDAATEALFETGIVPEDRDMAVAYTRVAAMLRNLDRNGRFSFTYRELEPDGSIRHKRVNQAYLDAQRRIIVMTREDITALIQDETRKNAALASALEAANAASLAKSQFLSRMSHELRTPMNAIIGLSALAASDVNDPVMMEDTISKIGMSARYLLSLINDILEMSRIESGRMTLNEAPFLFEQLTSAVNNIIYEQAERKGVDYDAVVSGFLETSYVGDITKLQQILVNVLGNSVKFTGPGGKITLGVEQVRRSGERATVRFTVSDTGVGIDPDFLPHLFDAFTQEASSFTSTSTGTGLGLAITRSMVEMMNGTINVQSIKNVGSVFTIEVQLGVSERSQRQLELLSSLNLSQLRALVVDDDVVVCQTTKNVLATMGIAAEWVESGRQAVERVTDCHAAQQDYNTIFIDWKMPDMDGIETTRQIRRIVGPDVTIVIMTAYDWRMIESQAREAGVDLFMEKPLFQSTILSALEQLFARRQEKRETPVQPPQLRYHFAGRRVLLAEDHPLNVEVARRLLEQVGIQVTVVGNGLEALEAFTTAQDYYYDAILMDIRMPVMDGLAATRNIRSLKKAGSRAIPILAMTANAFDEDVELSMSSGMDAHLIKPIEPEVLFATLQRVFAERN